MKQQPFSICNELIHAGEKANLALQMPDLYSCAPFYMPIKIIHGKNPGPCILVFSTIDGNEMNGLEIVNRLINLFDGNQIAGTIIGVPVLNVYGLTHYPKIMPSGHNIAQCFPGKADGKYGERIAYLFTKELIEKCDIAIELDTGALNHNILPQVYCHMANPQARKLAKAFQVPVITDVKRDNNHFRQTTENLDKPLIVYQAGEAMRFDAHAIQTGVDGIINVMRECKMLDDAPPANGIKPVFSKEEDWIIAHKGGILHHLVELGQTISRGDKIGTITDPFSADLEEAVYANQDGVVVGINTTPLIHEGLSIFKIASFLDNDFAEDAIGTWEEQQQENQSNV